MRVRDIDGEDASTILWDLATGDVLKRLKGHDALVQACAFSRDGAQLATAGRDKTSRVWSVETGKCLRTLKHASWVSAVAFRPDGSYLATASYDLAAHLWDLGTGDERGVFKDPDTGSEGADPFCYGVAFDPSGLVLATSASASYSGKALFPRRASRKCCARRG